MKRLSIVVAAAMTLLLLTVAAASAGTFVIPVDTIIYEPPGTQVPLGEFTTPPDLIGSTCEGVAVAQNQESVHEGNDIIISTGGTTAVLYDVEGAVEKTTVASGPVTLGPTLTLTLSMGPDGVFSGGFAITIDVDCVPPPEPVIEITKTADPTIYVNNTGEFMIEVHNPGPLDLHDVHVTDDFAINIDPTSQCPIQIGDLAVGETHAYECTIKGLNGVSPYTNEATAIGTGPYGTQVTDTDEATVVPEVLNTTLTTPSTTEPPTTQPPTTTPPTTELPGTTEAPSETLPVTGINSDQARGFGVAGILLVLAGIVLLSGAAVIGQYRQQ